MKILIEKPANGKYGKTLSINWHTWLLYIIGISQDQKLIVKISRAFKISGEGNSSPELCLE